MLEGWPLATPNVGRSEEKIQLAIDHVNKPNPTVSAIVVAADLSTVRKAVKVAEDIKNITPKIQTVICAGIMDPGKDVDFVDGIESWPASSHVAHFDIANLFVTQPAKGKEARPESVPAPVRAPVFCSYVSGRRHIFVKAPCRHQWHSFNKVLDLCDSLLKIRWPRDKL